MADAEVQTPVTRFRKTVHEQTGDRRELNAEVRANHADRRRPPNSRTGVGAQAAESEMPVRRPHVAGVSEQDDAKPPADREAQLAGHLEQRLPTDRESRGRKRRDFVPAPAAQTARAAEK